VKATAAEARTTTEGASFRPEDRSKAIGAWTGFAGVGTAIGPFLGGWLIAAVSWRLIFIINLPVAVVVLVVGLRHVPESRGPDASGKLDISGAALVTFGLIGLTYGLIEGPASGWGKPLTLIALAVGVALLAGFLVRESRVSKPLLPLSMFASAEFSAANVVTFVVYGALGGALFLLPIQLEQVSGYTAIQAGISLLPVTFLMLLLVFTLFELLGDILRNQISPVVVGAYLLNVSPYFVYNITPLSMLLAVLITLGVMQRSNEVTAIKTAGMSIYRIVTPLLVASAILAAGLFFADQFYLPHANKRQDALRNQIKGKPAQTYLNPDRKWIFGQHSDIYYYELFDSDRDQFGRLAVFQFDPATFQLTKRIYADRAHWEDTLHRWVCTQGWERDLRGPAIDNFRTFEVATFPFVSEPPTYFKKEVKQSSEMNYEELRRYIRDLQQSGFDVVRLRVQLQKKLAFPIITLVMAVLAIPFALSAGRHGAIAGVAVAVGIAVVYWTVAGLFEAMGNISQLPPVLAAWSPDLIFALVGGYLVLKVPT